MKISCVILAGGKGLRFGQDKVLEAVGNRSLLEQVVSRISQLSCDIIVVTARERTFPRLASYLKPKIVTDTFPDKGPLGGIYTGLTTSASFYNLVVACDMPFLNLDLLRYMVDLAEDFDMVIPRLASLVEPLHAVYAKSCLTAIEGMFQQGNLSVRNLLDLTTVRYIEAEEIDRFDPEHLSFFNVNTKADLIKARELATRMAHHDNC